jgi:hypothetical protein
MTIKQQGGIFGRNPTFNDVTVEGTLTTSGAQSFEELNVDNISIDGNTISSTNTNGNVTIDPDGTGFLNVQLPATAGVPEAIRITNPQNAGTFGDGSMISFQNTSDSNRSARIESFSRGAYGQSTSFRFMINNGTAAPRNVFQMLGDTGDVYVTEANLRLSGGGNVIMNSGSGIDFSATSGTGTSELFDDYEEGTWTPTGNGITFSAATGTYTKIGNSVRVTAEVTFPTTASISYADIGGLPFTSAAENTPTAVWSNHASGIYALVLSSGTSVRLYSNAGAAFDNVNLSTELVKISVIYGV